MNAKQLFHRMMQERRKYPRGSIEWDWRTRAARKYVWMMRKVPTCCWPVEG